MCVNLRKRRKQAIFVLPCSSAASHAHGFHTASASSHPPPSADPDGPQKDGTVSECQWGYHPLTPDPVLNRLHLCITSVHKYDLNRER